jgi:hypothetical protein
MVRKGSPVRVRQRASNPCKLACSGSSGDRSREGVSGGSAARRRRRAQPRARRGPSRSSSRGRTLRERRSARDPRAPDADVVPHLRAETGRRRVVRSASDPRTAAAARGWSIVEICVGSDARTRGVAMWRSRRVGRTSDTAEVGVQRAPIAARAVARGCCAARHSCPSGTRSGVAPAEAASA